MHLRHEFWPAWKRILGMHGPTYRAVCPKCARCIKMMQCTPDAITDSQAIVMEAGAMRSIVALLRAGSPSGRDSAAWALAELAAVDVYGTRAAMRREKVTVMMCHATSLSGS